MSYTKAAQDLLRGASVQCNDGDVERSSLMTAMLRRLADDPVAVALVAKDLERGYDNIVNELLYGRPHQ